MCSLLPILRLKYAASGRRFEHRRPEAAYFKIPVGCSDLASLVQGTKLTVALFTKCVFETRMPLFSARTLVFFPRPLSRKMGTETPANGNIRVLCRPGDVESLVLWNTRVFYRWDQVLQVAFCIQRGSW